MIEPRRSASDRTSPFRSEDAKVRKRRVSPVTAYSGDRLLSEPTAGIPCWRWEPFFVPLSLAAIRAPAARTFKTPAFTDFALFNHLIRATAAVAGYAGPEASDFPVKLAPGYTCAD
jgi:hypothetical protein